MTNENPDVKKWINRLESSKKWRDKIAKDRGWDRLMDEYRLIWPMLEGKMPYNIAPINLVYSFVKTDVPSLYFRDPYISVNPLKKSEIVAARIKEEVINNKWRAKHMKRELKRAIVDTLIIGHSWIKIGYQADTVTIEGADPKKDKQTPSMEVDERISNEDIFSYKMNWDEVLFSKDSKYANLDARWMAYRFVKPTKALRESKRYVNTKDLKGNFYLFGNDNQLSRKTEEGDIEMSVGWEIWDKDRGQKFAIVEGMCDYLQEPIDWPYPFDDFPVASLQFTEDPKCPYGISSIGPWEKQILEKIKLRAMSLNHVKLWNRQGFVKKGVLTKTEKDKYLENIDGTLIEVKSQNLGGDILFPTYPNFQPDAYVVEDRIDMDIRNVGGQPETRRGATTPTKTRTLGELEAINQYADVQASERQDLVEDFCEDIAQKQLALIKEFFDIDKVATISDESPPDVKRVIEEYFSETDRHYGNSFSYNKVDLAGDETCEVRAGSTLPLNHQNKQQILQTLIASSSQILPPQVVQAMVRELLRSYELKVIDQAFDDAEKEAKVQRIVQDALQGQQQAVRASSVQARQLGLANGEGGLEVPEIP